MSRFTVITLFAIAGVVAAVTVFDGRSQAIAVRVVVFSFLALLSIGVIFIGSNLFGPVLCRGTPGLMRVALTFDDGPDPVATLALLELLRQEKIPAAFFCIGKRVEANPQLAKQIVADGHLIGNHTYRHGWWTSLLIAWPLQQEIVLAQRAVKQATQVTPKHFRPPVGLTNPHFARAMRKLKLEMIGWSVRPRDTVRSAEAVIDHVVRKARDGSIIVLHDGNAPAEKIIAIVRGIVPALRAQGFEFERVDRLAD